MKIKTIRGHLSRPSAFSAAVIVFITNLMMVAAPVSAATLTTSYIRLNRMGTANATSLRVQFKAISAGATSVAINFNGADSTTWTGQSGALGAQASQTSTTAACVADTGDTALAGTHTFVVSGSTLTINGVTALSAGSTYCVDLTFASAVTTPTSAGEFHPTITAGSDSTTVAVRVVTGNTGDQVTVNAIVPPTFNFAIGGCASNIDNFTANLSSASVISTGGCTITVNTNAKTGWFAWAKDSSTGLVSTAAVKTIASVATGSTSTLVANGTNENYGFGVTSVAQGSGAGTTSAATAYDATATGGVNATVGGLDGTLRAIASSTGTATSAVVTVKERAVISTVTPAANDYTDTITLVGAGSF